MHIVLTDIVTCPRCGPAFGLIILADRIDDRRVMEGWLGCANCRQEYPVIGGVADLRLAGGAADAGAGPRVERADDAELAFRIAALLGVTDRGPPVLVHGAAPAFVSAVQSVVPDAGVVGLSREPVEGGKGVGMGWLLAGGDLPFRDRSLGGVALLGGGDAPPVEDALRCLARGARLVLDPATSEGVERLAAAGAEILLQQDGVAVAFDPRAG